MIDGNVQLKVSSDNAELADIYTLVKKTIIKKTTNILEEDQRVVDGEVFLAALNNCQLNENASAEAIIS